MPVASQDPIVAITCILHSSGDAAMAGPAEGQPGLLRDDDGLDDAEEVTRPRTVLRIKVGCSHEHCRCTSVNCRAAHLMGPHPTLSREKMATWLIRARPELCRRLAAALPACRVTTRPACKRRCRGRTTTSVTKCVTLRTHRRSSVFLELHMGMCMNLYHRLQVVFLYEHGCEAGELAERVHRARVRRFPSEMAMLRAWKAWLLDRDPDAFVLFEVRFPGRQALAW